MSAAEEWGTWPPPRRRRSPLLEQVDLHLAQHAQALRAESATGGYATELAEYFDQHDGTERRLRARDVAEERRRLAEHGRNQELVHGTARAHAICRQADGRRCAECRAYQRWRVAQNRAARRDQLCTGTRSSYDAGCRCARCTAANADGCARWRARQQEAA